MANISSLLEAFDCLTECEDDAVLQVTLTDLLREVHFQPIPVIEKVAARADVMDSLVHLMRTHQDRNGSIVCLAGQVLHVFSAHLSGVVAAMVETRLADFLWLLVVQYQTTGAMVQMCVTLLNDIATRAGMEAAPTDAMACIVALMGAPGEDPKFLIPACQLLGALARQPAVQPLLAQCGTPAALSRLVRGSRLPDVFHAACTAVSVLTERACVTQTAEGCMDFLMNLLAAGMSNDIGMEPDILESSCLALQAFARSPHTRAAIEKHSFVGPLLMYSEVFCDDLDLCCAIYNLLIAFTTNNASAQRTICRETQWVQIITNCLTGAPHAEVSRLAAQLLANLENKAAPEPPPGRPAGGGPAVPSPASGPEMDRLRKELELSRTRAVELEEQLAAASLAVEAQATQLARMLSLANVEAELAVKTAETAALCDAVAAAEAAAAGMTARLTLRTGRLVWQLLLGLLREKELVALRSELEDARGANAAAEQQLLAVQEECAALRRQVATLEAGAGAVASETAELTGTLESLRAALEEQQREREAAVAAAQASRSEREGAERDAEATVLRLTGELQALEAVLAQERATGLAAAGQAETERQRLEAAVAAAEVRCTTALAELEEERRRGQTAAAGDAEAARALAERLAALEMDLEFSHSEAAQLRTERDGLQAAFEEGCARRDELQAQLTALEAMAADLRTAQTAAEGAAEQQRVEMAEQQAALAVEQRLLAEAQASQAEAAARWAESQAEAGRQLRETENQLQAIQALHTITAQQLASVTAALEVERGAVEALRACVRSAAEEARAAAQREVTELQAALRDAQAHTHELLAKQAAQEEAAREAGRVLQRRDAQLVALEAWGARCHRDLLEQFDYREIAIRVGVRESEEITRLGLLDWHDREVQRANVVVLHRQEIERVQRREAAELQVWSPFHLRYLQRLWEIAGLGLDQQARPRSQETNEDAPKPATPQARYRVGAGARPSSKEGDGLFTSPAASPTSAEPLAKHDGPALGTLAGARSDGAAPWEFSGGPAHTDHVNPSEVSIEAVCADSAVLKWELPPGNHPRALYQVLLAEDAGEYRIHATVAGGHCSLQGLKPSRQYATTVRVLVEPMQADRHQVVLTFRTTTDLEPRDGRDCLLAAQEVSISDLPLARHVQGRGHPKGLAVDKASLGPTACLLQWTSLPNHFPAQYVVWLSRDSGLSFVACGLTGSSQHMLRDLQPGMTYSAAVTSGFTGQFNVKGNTVAFTTKTRGVPSAALPPPKTHLQRKAGVLTLEQPGEEPLSPLGPLTAMTVAGKLKLASSPPMPKGARPTNAGTSIVQPGAGSHPLWAEKAWLYGSPGASAAPDGLGASSPFSEGLGANSIMGLHIGGTLALLGEDADPGDSTSTSGL